MNYKKMITLAQEIGNEEIELIVRKTESKEIVELGVTKLTALGFNVKLSEHLFDKKRYLAGDDDIRVNELEKNF